MIWRVCQAVWTILLALLTVLAAIILFPLLVLALAWARVVGSRVTLRHSSEHEVTGDFSSRVRQFRYLPNGTFVEVEEEP